jgi:aspartate aminotransferase
MSLSKLAQGIQTSEIILLAAEINEKIQNGEKLYNLTIGDFNPRVFPIPTELKEEIIAAYNAGYTNYPGAAGLPVIRNAISKFLKDYDDLDYQPDQILISCGGRPLIYAAYRIIVDPGEKVIFPVPSWNNNHYTYLSNAIPIAIETTPENNFMPTAQEIRPHLKEAALLALCSPQNPTGTVLQKNQLEEICDLVMEENKSRGSHQKPLYVFFDQIYWQLVFGDTKHYNPVNIRPEIKDYIVFVDGLSKAFAGTGVRVGWAFGPKPMIAKMRSVVAHMGSWAPRAEQVAVGNYLKNEAAVESYLTNFRRQIEDRLRGFYKGFMHLKENGYSVDAIVPQAALYLTVQLDLVGKNTQSGILLDSNAAVHKYILDEAKVGLVPFPYFGASEESNWYRLSVGTCRLEDVEGAMSNLEQAHSKLN